MKKIEYIILFSAIFLIGILIDLMFTQFIVRKIGIWDNLIVAGVFTCIYGYSYNLRRNHVCHYTIPVGNSNLNDNVRILTHKCECGAINETTAHKDSVAYKKFIHEIR